MVLRDFVGLIIFSFLFSEPLKVPETWTEADCGEKLKTSHKIGVRNKVNEKCISSKTNSKDKN